jgi:hypothetical protein
VATGKSNYGVAVGAAAPFAPATPNATERAVKALTAVEAFPHAGVISSSFLKQRNAPKQQEYLEDAVMFNKRADYGTGRHLLNIIALPDFLRKHCGSLETPEDHGASSITSARRRKLSTPLVPADKLTQS